MNPLWLNPEHQYEYRVRIPAVPASADLPWINADASRVYVKFSFAWDYSLLANPQYVALFTIGTYSNIPVSMCSPFNPFVEFNIWTHGPLAKEAFAVSNLLGSAAVYSVLEILDRGPLGGK